MYILSISDYQQSVKIVSFSPSVVLLGTTDKDIGLNIIILLVKKHTILYQTSRKKYSISFNDVQIQLVIYCETGKKLLE
jgi:hypothetical protein